jgi:hypothetical protein
MSDEWIKREQYLVNHADRPRLNISEKTRNLLTSTYPLHFLHLAKKKPGFVSYTKDHVMGEKNRRTSCSALVYLSRYFPNIEDHIHDEIVNAANIAVSVKFATTPEEITKVYRNYDDDVQPVANSCMRYAFNDLPCHPCSIYGAGDLAIAYLVNNSGDTTHRCLCWPEKKLYSRVFANGGALHCALKDLGYQKTAYYNDISTIGEACYYGTFEGARLLKIPHNGTYIMPYIDEKIGVSIGEKFIILTRNGDYEASETTGLLVYEEPDDDEGCDDEEPDDDEGCDDEEEEGRCGRCGRCGRRANDLYTVVASNQDYVHWCDGCTNRAAVWMSTEDVYWSQTHFNRSGTVSQYSEMPVPSRELVSVVLTDGLLLPITKLWHSSEANEDTVIMFNDNYYALPIDHACIERGATFNVPVTFDFDDVVPVTSDELQEIPF